MFVYYILKYMKHSNVMMSTINKMSLWNAMDKWYANRMNGEPTVILMG